MFFVSVRGSRLDGLVGIDLSSVDCRLPFAGLEAFWSGPVTLVASSCPLLSFAGSLEVSLFGASFLIWSFLWCQPLGVW